ncbi:MAG: hypothetical protein WEE67_04385 [Chloroflexota bacterium]
MADPSRQPDTDVEYDTERTSGMPRWQKVAIVVTILVLVAVVVMLVGGVHTPPPGVH